MLFFVMYAKLDQTGLSWFELATVTKVDTDVMHQMHVMESSIVTAKFSLSSKLMQIWAPGLKGCILLYHWNSTDFYNGCHPMWYNLLNCYIKQIWVVFEFFPYT